MIDCQGSHVEQETMLGACARMLPTLSVTASWKS